MKKLIEILLLIRKSRHWDFVSGTLLIIGLIASVVIGHQILWRFFSWFPISLMDNLDRTASASVVLFIAFIVADIRFYIFENLFYVYLKRNGNNNFDYQEALKKLTEWQRVKIVTVKYICYLALFVYLVK